MKAIKFLALPLLGFLMGACSEHYDDWADPITNPAEDAITIPGFSASGVSSIDIAQQGDESSVFALSTANLPEGYQLANARVEFTPQGAATTAATTVATTIDGMAQTQDLQTLVESAFGKRPEARPFTAQVYLNAVKGGQAVLIDAGQFTVNITPKAPHISSAYYLVGDMLTWGIDQSLNQKFQHSDKDVYDDPVFTLFITTTAPNQYWKIIPQENVDAGNIWQDGVVGVAVDGDDALAGTLINQGANAGKIAEAGKYIMTINMMDYSYTLQKVDFGEYLYMAGDANGWAQVDLLSSPSFDGIYTGYMYLNQNGFKFCTEPNWNGTNYGEGFSTDGGAGNMMMQEPEGYYKVVVDLTKNSLDLTAITTIGLIGDATAGGWNTDTPLTFNKSERCWEGDVTLADGTFKFRANNDWGINWGGDKANLAADGPNIEVSAGTYSVKFWPNCPGKATCTLTAK